MAAMISATIAATGTAIVTDQHPSVTPAFDCGVGATMQIYNRDTIPFYMDIFSNGGINHHSCCTSMTFV